MFQAAFGTWRRWQRGLSSFGDDLADVRNYLRGVATQNDAPTELCFTSATAARPLKMLLRRPGHIEHALASDGAWEANVRDTVAFFMDPDGVFIDVGANIGYHSLYIACAMPEARVIAFEPNPVVRRDLERNMRWSAVSNLLVQAQAVGDHEGSVEFYAQSERAYNRGTSSLVRNFDLGDRFQKIEVPLVTLDAQLDADTAKRVCVMKVDAEGCELDVLRGAQQLIRRARPVILLEFESRYFEDAVGALAKLTALLEGYTFHRLGRGTCEMTPLCAADVRSRLFRADLCCIPDAPSDPLPGA